VACAVSDQKGLAIKFPPKSISGGGANLKASVIEEGTLLGNSSPTPNISLFGAELDLRDTAGCMIYSKPRSAFASGDAHQNIEAQKVAAREGCSRITHHSQAQSGHYGCRATRFECKNSI